jgi:amidase
MLRRAQVQTHRSYIEAEDVRAKLQAAWADFFADFDILLCPVTLSAAYPVDEETVREQRRIRVSDRWWITMTNCSGRDTVRCRPYR